jgi:hypothetical protein
MNEPLNTKITIAEPYGRQKIGNLTLEDARFWGRPNFSGEMDQFKDDRRKFSVLIPNELADGLRDLGWNVKTTLPTPEEVAAGKESTSGLKVMLNFRTNENGEETGPDVWLIMGEQREKLTSKTIGVLDRSRIIDLAMEIRAWEYDPDDNPGKFSARLVQLVAVIEPNLLQSKYGIV